MNEGEAVVVLKCGYENYFMKFSRRTAVIKGVPEIPIGIKFA